METPSILEDEMNIDVTKVCVCDHMLKDHSVEDHSCLAQVNQGNWCPCPCFKEKPSMFSGKKLKLVWMWVCSHWGGNFRPIHMLWIGLMQPLPDGRRYDLEKDDYLYGQMVMKITQGVKQFGSFEAYMYQFDQEIREKRMELDLKILVLRCRQMQRKWMIRHRHGLHIQ